MKDILIVIDMQNDFIDGSLGSPEAQAIVPAVKAKIEEYDKAFPVEDNRIFFTKDVHYHSDASDSLYNKHKSYLDTIEGKHLPVEHCIIDTPGIEIPRELHPVNHNMNITYKHAFGMIDWEFIKDFEKIIDRKCTEGKVVEIEICGLCTDICVVSNALILKSLYYNVAEIYIDPTCCAGTSKEAHDAALLIMEKNHINVMK